MLFNGKPLDNAPVRMSRINTDKQSAPTPWQEELAARTDKNGQFAFVLNQSGWWCCAAIAAGDPLKGPDGQSKPPELARCSGFMWTARPPSPASVSIYSQPRLKTRRAGSIRLFSD